MRLFSLKIIILKVFFGIMIFMALANFSCQSPKTKETTETALIVEENDGPISLFIITKYRDSILNTGTGFIATYKGKEYLIINYHALTGKEPDGRIRNIRPDAIQLLGINNSNAQIFVQFSVDDPWKEYIDRNGFRYDIVSIELHPGFPLKVQKYSLDQSNNLEDSDSVNVYGFPKSYAESPANNRYPIEVKAKAGNFINKNTEEPWDYIGCMIWNEKLQEGASGSPVFNSYGTLLGIYSSKVLNGTTTFGIFFRVNAIRRVISDGSDVKW